MLNSKLYTEEQVLRMLEVCRDSDLYEHILTFEDILKTETTIELPSDEEIKEEAERLYPLTLEVSIDSRNHLIKKGFINGMEWLRDKIGGNK